MDLSQILFAVVIVGLGCCIVYQERRLNRVYKRVRYLNARFDAIEKAVGVEQTKTDIGMG